MINYFLDAFKNKYADFKGRARRSEYWYYTLVLVIIFVVAMILDNILGTTFKMGEIDLGYGYSYVLVTLATFVPSLATVVRRLHDVGKSGWFYFIILIPIVGAIWLIVLLCTDSVSGPNKWGPNPKGVGNGSASDLIDTIGQ
jgi:uncharacterized membrane protein YhaH (DUF805 family)